MNDLTTTQFNDEVSEQIHEEVKNILEKEGIVWKRISSADASNTMSRAFKYETAIDEEPDSECLAAELLEAFSKHQRGFKGPISFDVLGIYRNRAMRPGFGDPGQYEPFSFYKIRYGVTPL